MKRYLGDGVYVESVDGGLILTAENNDIKVTDRIYLVPQVYSALAAFVAELKEPKR